MLRIYAVSVKAAYREPQGKIAKGDRLRFVHFGLFFLIGGLVLSTGCSYGTAFVVVNRSDQPVQVSYRIRNVPGDLRLVCVKPTIMAAKDLGTSKAKWQDLSDSQYQVEPERRTIILTLKAEEALLISSFGSARNKEDETAASLNFCTDQIEISGAYGQIKLFGPQVYMGFSEVSQNLRTLRYQR